MKPKEIVQLAVALVIFAVAGFLIYSQMNPKKSGSEEGKGPQIEKITALPSGFDSDAMSTLSNSTKNRDFYTAPDLKNGIGNPHPFAPTK